MKIPSFKLGLIVVTIFFSFLTQMKAQVHVYEDFESYYDFEEFKTTNFELQKWSYYHAENEDFNGNGIIDTHENIKSTQIIEFEPNNHALEFQLNRSDSSLIYGTIKTNEVEGNLYDGMALFHHANRNEIATWDYPNLTSYLPNRTYEFSYDIFIPADFVFEEKNCADITKANYELVGQWHISYEVLNGKTKPPASLRIQCNRWVLSLNTNETEESDIHYFFPGEIERGKWVNWRFQLKFSHKKRGKVLVWKDGELVYEREKFKTMFAKFASDGKLNTLYFKIGVYKPHWWSRETNVSSRRLLYDNVLAD